MTRGTSISSIRRRLHFAAESRYFFSKLGARLGVSSEMSHLPDFAATFGFDLLESVRNRGLVPFLGEARKAIHGCNEPVNQHPRYRYYWHEPSRHSLVGMHLGVDLILHEGRFLVLEVNLGAAIRPERRALYDSELDPLVESIVSAASEGGFKKVVPYSTFWTPPYVSEFERAGEKFGVEVVAASFPWAGQESSCQMIALPEVLEPDTFYLHFSSNRSPVDHYVHDKISSSLWLKNQLGNKADGSGGVGFVPTYDRPTIEEFDDTAPWPNFVVKPAGWDKGIYVRVAKLRSRDEALELLRPRSWSGMPRIMNMGLKDEVRSALLKIRKLIYQPYIPSMTDSEGRQLKFRLHILVSPLMSRFLSVHQIRAGARIPEKLPVGLVDDTRPFVLSFRGGARYQRCAPELEVRIRQETPQICAAVHNAISKRFETRPHVE